MTTNRNPNKKRGAYKSSGYKTVHQVTLDDKTVDILTAFGNGNLSAGVRMAAAFIEEWKSKEVSK